MAKLVIATLAGLIVGVIAGYFGAGGGKPSVAPVAAVPAESVAGPATEGEKYRPILDMILAGLLKKDFNVFSHDFQPEVKSESRFNVTAGLVESLGGLSKPVFVASYLKGGTLITLWKAKSLKSGEDALITLSLFELDGKYKVIDVFVQ